mgnify:CR=1 FL=1
MPKTKYSSYIKGGKVKKRMTPYEQRMADRKKLKKGNIRPKKSLGYSWRKESEDFGAEAERIGKPHSRYKLKKKKYKGGGKVDTEPAMLTVGEVVLNAKQQEKLGKLVGLSSSELFGKIGVPGFKDGGKVKKKTKYSSYIKGGKVKKEKRMPRDLTPEELKKFNKKDVFGNRKHHGSEEAHPKKSKKGEIRRDSRYDEKGRPFPDPQERDYIKKTKKVYMKSKL